MKNYNYIQFHQPDFENKNQYKRYIIPQNSPLYGIVYDIYELHGARGYREQATVIPSSFFSFEISYIKQLEYVNSYGSVSKSNHIVFDETDSLIIEVFPWINLNFPSREPILHDEVFECTHEVEKYHNVLKLIAQSSSFDEKISVCLAFLNQFLADYTFYSSVISATANLILNANDDIALADISQVSGYCSRQIQRIYKKQLGYGPHLLTEIIKFQKSLDQLLANPDMSHSDVAWNCGFYDLSHMNKTYKALTNYTVKQLLNHFSLNTNRRNFS